VQALGQRGDFTEDQQRRRAHGLGMGAFGQVGERAENDPLFGARAVLDQRERRAGGSSVRDQSRAEVLETGHAHVHRERLSFLRQCAPVHGIQ
jgi:hypothetical protein